MTKKDNTGLVLVVVGIGAWLLLGGKKADAGGGSESGNYPLGTPGENVYNVNLPGFQGFDTKKEAVLTGVYPAIGRKEYVVPGSGQAYYTVPQVNYAMPVDINPATGFGYSVPAGTKSSLLHTSPKYPTTTKKNKYGVHTG